MNDLEEDIKQNEWMRCKLTMVFLLLVAGIFGIIFGM